MPLANSLFCDRVAVELRFHGDLRVSPEFSQRG
jgi:hypothetical protein